MTCEDLADAFIPEPHTVLGLRLRPLSLGHLLLLYRVRSSFVCGGAPGYDDLAVSVLICSLSYADGIEALDSDKVDVFMDRWQKALTRPVGFWNRILNRRTPINLAEKSLAFANYINAGWKHPDYAAQEGGNSIDLPFIQAVRVTLLREFAMSEAELMDRSWSACLWDYLSIKALDGHISLVDNKAIQELLASAPEIEKKLREKGLING